MSMRKLRAAQTARPAIEPEPPKEVVKEAKSKPPKRRPSVTDRSFDQIARMIEEKEE